MTIRERLITAYKKMYELTEPECSHSCRVPRSCCSLEYCQMAQEIAREHWQTEITPFGNGMFLGDKGCVVPPHMRPLCTFHTCAVNSLGQKLGDPKWNRRYFRLRAVIEGLEWKLNDMLEKSGDD